MMSNPFYEHSWFTILLTGFVGIMTFVTKDIWTKHRDKKNKQRDITMLAGLKSIRVIYESMEQIQKLTNADRVLLLEVSNSGSLPRAGEKIYSRAIEVKLENEAERLPILNTYEQVRVDQHYISMVIQVKTDQKPYVFDVKTHQDCLLRRIYEQEKIEYSEIYHVYSDTVKWKQFIISVSTYKEGERFEDEHQRAIISNNIHRIRQTFELIR